MKIIKPISKSQIIRIQTLLSKCNLRAQKANIVLGASLGRTEHVSGLTFDEAEQVTLYLQTQYDQRNWAELKKLRRMRNKILSMAHELRWRTDGKINMKAVNAWCEKYGYLHKPLDDYSLQELPRLVHQFQNGPYRNFIKRL